LFRRCSILRPISSRALLRFIYRGRQSALAQPQWHYRRTLQRKAAVLHYHLNRDHPFIDGNKRFAITAMETFLTLNDAVLLATDKELEDFSLAVAGGELSREGSFEFVKYRTSRLY